MFPRLCAPPLLLLPLLLVLWPVRVVSAGAPPGEFCHAWRNALGFHCPERHDEAEARYCCGSCALRYCCSSAAARLDQSTCEPEPEPELAPGRNDGVRDLQPSLPTYLPFVIVVSVFLSFVLLGTVVSVCCCHCLKPKPGSAPNPTPTTQVGLLESGGPSPKSSTPSRSSTAGSSGPLPPAPTPSELSLYGGVGPAVGVGPLFPGPQPPTFAPPVPAQFYPPYMSYPLPPEHHTMALMAPAFLDGRSMFGQTHSQPFPHAPMHTEPIYPPVTV